MKSIALLVLAVAVLLLIPACSGTDSASRPKITIDPILGVCVMTQDGAYRACYNPITKGYSVKASVPGGVITNLTYDSATKTYRGELPDGSFAVYGVNGLTVEPPLPTK